MPLSDSERAFLDTATLLVTEQGGKPTPWQRGQLRALQPHADRDDAARITRLLADPEYVVPEAQQAHQEQEKAFERGAARATKPAYTGNIREDVT